MAWEKVYRKVNLVSVFYFENIDKQSLHKRLIVLALNCVFKEIHSFLVAMYCKQYQHQPNVPLCYPVTKWNASSCCAISTFGITSANDADVMPNVEIA